MDDKVLKTQKEKLVGLDKKLSDLAAKLRSTESRLDQEHQIVRQAASQRAVLVGNLVGASVEESRRLHEKIDGLDQQIRGAERMSESYQRLLETVKAETVEVTAARDKLNAVVGAETNARDFAAWQIAMQENFKAAHAAMAAAREALAKCTTEAARAGERFGGVAQSWAAAAFDSFEHSEHNADTLLNFRQATPWFRNTSVVIWPMTRV